MDRYSSRALIVLSVPANLLYPPRRRRKIRYGDWTVEIAGMTLIHCRVEFDSNGSLVIDVPDSVEEDMIDKLCTLPRKYTSAFRVAVSKVDLISAEFARCIYVSFGPAPGGGSTFIDKAAGQAQSGHRFELRYDTLPL